jgi:hypothetical protein
MGSDGLVGFVRFAKVPAISNAASLNRRLNDAFTVEFKLSGMRHLRRISRQLQRTDVS